MEVLPVQTLRQIKYETLKMLKNRGYIIPEDEIPIFEKTMTDTEFRNMYIESRSNTSHPLFSHISKKFHFFRSGMSNIYHRNDGSCLVFFADPEEKKISSDQMADFCRLIIEKKVDEAILIANVPATTITESLCNDVGKGQNSVFIQYFVDEELIYNPLEHVMTPHHRILTEREMKEMKEVDKIVASKLPRISALDPVCKRLGAKPDDIVEITRKILVKECLVSEEISYRSVFMPRSEKSRK